MSQDTKPKTRRRKEARPAEIIDAGIDEFAKYGFERARLDRIAKTAGISKGTIYLYYPSKEALFLAAAQEHVVRVMAEGETQLEGFEGTTEELLVHLLGTLYGQIVEGRARALLRILVAEGDRIPHVVSQYHDMAIKRGTQLIQRILARGVARGEVRESAILDNPHIVIAPAIFFAMHSMMFGKYENLSRDSFFKAHVEMMLRGILR